MKRTFLLISFCYLISITQSYATHIIGGNMSYRYVNNGKYAITLRLYRDCYGGLPFFDGESSEKGASIGVFKAVNGIYTFVDTLHVLLKQKQIIPIPNYPWLNKPSNICVEEGVYEFEYEIADFPSKANYTFAYQRCCRNATISNLLEPLNTGFTCDIEISADAQKLTNTSAVIKTPPPTIICANTALSINLSATDKDNDSLYYRFFKPRNGGSDLTPRPDPPSSPPFNDIVYKTNYDENNPLGNQGLILNGKTGILTNNKSALGLFVVGICIEEYRKGKLINKSYFDFQFNARACSLLNEENVLDDTSISISPNPFDEQLNITFKEEVDKLTIKDFFGRNIIQMTSVIDHQIINTRDLPKGIYFLSIEKGDNQIVKKIIKE